jgi:hypothetical protein
MKLRKTTILVTKQIKNWVKLERIIFIILMVINVNFNNFKITNNKNPSNF